MTDAICTGCGCHAKDTGEYSKHNPVTGDGTYADGQFVCTGCYMILVDKGCDVGEPIQLQRLADHWVDSRKDGAHSEIDERTFGLFVFTGSASLGRETSVLGRF
jgi:hypothetical protein